MKAQTKQIIQLDNTRRNVQLFHAKVELRWLGIQHSSEDWNVLNSFQAN